MTRYLPRCEHRRDGYDLGNVDSLIPGAAVLLLFRQAPWRVFAEKITLRANGKPGRQAVLRAYARRRARSGTA